MLGGLTEFEENGVRQDVQRAESALSNEISGLETKATDWSAWDDTYDFIQDENTEYIKSNLVDSTFINLRLNLMVFVDNSGRIVWAKAFDLTEKKEAPLGRQPGKVPLVQRLKFHGPTRLAPGVYIPEYRGRTIQQSVSVAGCLRLEWFSDKSEMLGQLALHTPIKNLLEVRIPARGQAEMVTASNEVNTANDETQFFLFRFLKNQCGRSFTVADLARRIGGRGNMSHPGASLDDSSGPVRLQKMLDDMVHASFVEKSVVGGQYLFGFNDSMKKHNLTRLGNHLWMFC